MTLPNGSETSNEVAPDRSLVPIIKDEISSMLEELLLTIQVDADEMRCHTFYSQLVELSSLEIITLIKRS